MIPVNFARVKSVLYELRSYPFWIAFAAVMLIAVVIYLISDGFYYQTESDTVFPAYIFGLYSGGSNVLPDTFGCFAGLSHLFNALYRHGASTAIYDWFQVLTVLGCSVYWLHHLIRTSNSLWLIIPVLIGLLDPMLPFEFSKTSMILSLTGLHLISSKKDWWSSGIGIMLLSVGFLVRPEPAAIAMLIVCISVFFGLGFIPKLHILTSSVVSVLVVSVLSIVFLQSDRTDADVYYKKFRPYEYVLVDFRKGELGLSGLDQSASVKLQAAQEFFFADREELSLEFFEKVGIRPMDKTPISLLKAFFRFDWLLDGVRSFVNGAASLKFHFLVLLLLTLIFWKRHRRAALFLLSVVLVILSVSIFLKTESHFITTMVMAALLIVGGEKKHSMHMEEVSSGLRIFFTTLVGLLSAMMLVEKAKLISTAQQKHEYYLHVQNELQEYEPDLLVLNISFWDKLHYRLFCPIQPEEHEKMTVLDGGTLYLNENYQQLMYAKTRKHRFIDQFTELMGADGKVFISSEERVKLIVKYVNVVYGKNYVCEGLNVFPLPANSAMVRPLGVFRIYEKGS